MMAAAGQREKAPRDEVSLNAIHRETIRKENRSQRLVTEFSINPHHRSNVSRRPYCSMMIIARRNGEANGAARQPERDGGRKLPDYNPSRSFRTDQEIHRAANHEPGDRLDHTAPDQR
ncbi:cilia- and flagella-associated protein 144 isoform X2 [Rhinoderma darwinii]|uniref:cilia- and flagella-associated protein 144 isoform X2 n=1 Tax=Rhinoderma darwinii TaxID=43563 RepID=UPI003F66181A